MKIVILKFDKRPSVEDAFSLYCSRNAGQDYGNKYRDILCCWEVFSIF